MTPSSSSGSSAGAPRPYEEEWIKSRTGKTYGEYLAMKLELRTPRRGQHRRRASAQLNESEQLGAYDWENGDGYLGFSLGKALKNVGKTVVKAAKDTGHAAGKAVTSGIGKAVIGGALALTGVGLPAAAAIGAASQAGGKLLKPGGNLKKAAGGAVEGAAIGAAGSIAGKIGRAGISKLKGPKSVPGSGAIDKLASEPVPGVSVTPSSMPTTQLELVKDAAPIAAAGTAAAAAPSLFKRVANASSPTSKIDKSGTATRRKNTNETPDKNAAKIAAAKKVVGAGSSAKAAADKGAAKIDKLTAQVQKLKAAAAKAKEIGDIVGASQLTNAAQAAEGVLNNTVNAGTKAAEDLRNAGTAAEGAATGAVAGAGLSTFLENNKTALLWGAGGIAALFILPRILPRSSSSHSRAA